MESDSAVPTGLEIGGAGPSGNTPRGLGPGGAVAVFLCYMAIQLLVGVFAGVVIGVWLAVRGDASDPAALASALQHFVMPIALMAGIAGGLFVLVVAHHRFGEPPRSGGPSALGWLPCTAREALWSAAAGATIACLVLFVVMPISGPVPPERWGPVAKAVSAGGWALHLWALYAVLVAPPVEEFVFRGVLLAGFSRSWTVASSGVVVTALFVLCHASELSSGAALLAVTLAGGATVVARVATGSLLPALVLHVAYNSVIAVSAYATAA